ncbi:unnamed protein product [Heterobilharzia americana]|nr:unnamed protein product [Heterobilharzia americana]
MATQVAGGLPKEKPKAVQVFGRKKTATAVAHCKLGSGSIRVNGRPLDVLEPRPLLPKLMEPILLLGNMAYPTWISGYESVVEAEWPRFTQLDKQLLNPLLRFTRNTLMNVQRMLLKKSSSSTTEVCWLLILEDANQRSLVVQVHVPDTKSLIVKLK